MALLTGLLVAILLSAGFYLIMRRNLLEVLLGTLLISHGVNLFLVSMGGWSFDEKPPIIMEEKHLPASAYVDPLPEALILTAIVIGFGVTAFLVVLLYRGYEENKELELGEMGKGEDEA